MAIVITNGTYYIRYSDNGKTLKTSDINKAYQFYSVKEAIKGMKQAKGKTKNYIVFDTLTNRMLWRHMTQAELIEVQETKGKRCQSVARKTYSRDTRKLIYNNAHGRCELCGRKILFEDMTIDHVKPLSMGGEDEVENLACTCYSCNMFKGNIMPDDFLERISLIYLYQMEKQHKNNLVWKVVYMMLGKLK